MANTNGGPGSPIGTGPMGTMPQSPAGGAQFAVLAQYTKDFSFENPGAPGTLIQGPGEGPALNIQINVTPKQLSNTDYEVELLLDGKAEVGTTVLFSFELNYAGVFRLANIPQEAIGPFVMIECPRLLFPFAREMVAHAVSSGGFPPLMLDPVDFVAMYRQRVGEMEAQLGAGAGAET
jgi:preprotein translocase subunit SecB